MLLVSKLEDVQKLVKVIENIVEIKVNGLVEDL